MSGSGAQSLFSLDLPDLRNLCCVNLFFPNSHDEGELRNKQVKTCRELILMQSDIVASPVLGHYGGISVIMTTALHKTGFIQAFAEKHGLQLCPPQRVFPAILQNCLSYTVTTKLAPKWNKAGQYLIAGKDFLSDTGKLNAVVLEMNITETQLCGNVEVKTVRLPPAEIQDFDFPAPVVINFLHTKEAVLHTVMPNSWCHILPSMKKGQIISISRRIPEESPFQSYLDIQKHWSNMYGYQLPSVGEEDVIYCSVYFKPIGDKLFTYPLSCIRTQPIQCFPRVDLQGVLRTFISDLQAELKSVCGFPVQMTCKTCFYNSELNRPVAQYSAGLPVNLTTENSSRGVLNPLPSSNPRDTTKHHYSQCDSTGKPTEKRKRLNLDSSLHQKDWTSSNLATQFSSSPTNIHFTQIQAQYVPPRPKLVPVFNCKPVNATEVYSANRLTAVVRPLSSISISSSSEPHCSTSPARVNQITRPSVPQRMTLPFSKSKADTRILPPLPFSQTIPQIVPQIPSNTGGDMIQSKPKRLKQSLQDVEVHARNNQLSKINISTLHAWLKSRGINVRSKDKKEELVSRVMRSLSES
ncbi:uncharacterized protein C18orf63 homolog [Danio rerio]|uniref:Uncharacterized protein C18orf63 homolog n=6 Tax=Danio rerio TaxID=7955 RepID=A0AC58ITB1_DANRE